MVWNLMLLTFVSDVVSLFGVFLRASSASVLLMMLGIFSLCAPRSLSAVRLDLITSAPDSILSLIPMFRQTLIFSSTPCWVLTGLTTMSPNYSFSALLKSCERLESPSSSRSTSLSHSPFCIGFDRNSFFAPLAWDTLLNRRVQRRKSTPQLVGFPFMTEHKHSCSTLPWVEILLQLINTGSNTFFFINWQEAYVEFVNKQYCVRKAAPAWTPGCSSLESRLKVLFRYCFKQLFCIKVNPLTK